MSRQDAGTTKAGTRYYKNEGSREAGSFAEMILKKEARRASTGTDP